MNISIIIPTYNEEVAIRPLLTKLSQLSSSDFVIDVVVVDGLSTDNTFDIVSSVITSHSSPNFSVRILENPDRLQASALNIGLRHSRYTLCLRLDAHLVIGNIAKLKSSLIRANSLLISNQTSLVGFKQRFIFSNNILQNSLFLLSLSPLLSGLRRYRLSNRNCFTKTTVWLFCTFKHICLNAGGFNLSDVPNEDMSLNERVYSLSNLPHYLDVEPELYYHPRKTLVSLFRQYFRYSYSRTYRRIHSLPFLWGISFFLGRSFVFLLAFLVILFLSLSPSVILLYLFIFFFFLFSFFSDSSISVRALPVSPRHALSLVISFLITPYIASFIYFASFYGSLRSFLPRPGR